MHPSRSAPLPCQVHFPPTQRPLSLQSCHLDWLCGHSPFHTLHPLLPRRSEPLQRSFRCSVVPRFPSHSANAAFYSSICRTHFYCSTARPSLSIDTTELLLAQVSSPHHRCLDHQIPPPIGHPLQRHDVGTHICRLSGICPVPNTCTRVLNSTPRWDVSRQVLGEADPLLHRQDYGRHLPVVPLWPSDSNGDLRMEPAVHLLYLAQTPAVPWRLDRPTAEQNFRRAFDCPDEPSG